MAGSWNLLKVLSNFGASLMDDIFRKLIIIFPPLISGLSLVIVKVVEKLLYGSLSNFLYFFLFLFVICESFV